MTTIYWAKNKLRRVEAAKATALREGNNEKAAHLTQTIWRWQEIIRALQAREELEELFRNYVDEDPDPFDGMEVDT